MQFVIGVKELDEAIGRALMKGATILIAGNPGTGKTTLAATICYNNALRGIPCAYITFHENKSRFISQMKSFNMDFEELEKKGLFRFYRFPLVTSPDLIGDLLEEINEIVKKGPGVIVIDSITPLGKIFERDIEARALLQNYFYNLANIIGGLVVLIAEVPLGKEVIALGDIEFTSDIAIILKHKIEKGLLVRLMEIRKVRGAPVKIAEVPFAIIDGVGLQVMTPPILSRIVPPKYDVEIKIPCKQLARELKHLHPGQYIYVAYQADAYNPYIMPLLLATITMNNLKTLVISYVRSPREAFAVFTSISTYEKEIREEQIKKLFGEDKIIVESINPASCSIEELNSLELQLIDKYQPEVVIFDGAEIPCLIHGFREPDKYFMYLRNQLLRFRDLGILTIRISALINEEIYRRESSIADVVLRFEYRERNGRLEPWLYLWKIGYDPIILGPDEVRNCMKECLNTLWGG
ncbi:AAA family ATPase [Desulfurococcaceae archaeon MEX13E-LK6-19]|nr:AAA family ATPase [Desulfurococcaceae archaeon MEX13E-LK6-19]